MEGMKLIEIQRNDAHRLAPLAAAFRVTLNGYRGIVSEPDIPAGRAEIIEFLDAGSEHLNMLSIMMESER